MKRIFPNRIIKVLDTCSGLGMFSHAIRNVIGERFRSSGFIEIDSYAQSQIRELFPELDIIYGDIRKTFPKKKADIITGAFPCQDLSIASQAEFEQEEQRIDGERSGIWREQLRIIRRLRPPVVIMENTPLIVRRGLHAFLREFTQSRYAVWWSIISAEEIGFPHRRKRWFAVLFDTDRIGFDTVSIFNREFEKILHETRTKAQQRMESQFGRLFSSDFWEKDYAEFLQMDNEYSAKENQEDIKCVGNSLVPDIVEMIMKALIIADEHE